MNAGASVGIYYRTKQRDTSREQACPSKNHDRGPLRRAAARVVRERCEITAFTMACLPTLATRATEQGGLSGAYLARGAAWIRSKRARPASESPSRPRIPA